MSYYEKLGWKLGKENEIFLKKGPEKLFFETLEELNPKYVEVFKELLKYINKNSIVAFIPLFFRTIKMKKFKLMMILWEKLKNTIMSNL